jgi:diacylglycerol kinase family enzyme
VAETERRGHAIELGAQARADGYDVVVVFGGDGTVNEVVNGVLGDDGPDPEQPALAVVPGGSTNVFHRALGIPRDPIEATGAVLDAVRDGRSRLLGLGRADERWFTFTAGLGLDADAVRVVEEARARGTAATPVRYAAAAVGRFYRGTDRRHPALSLQLPGEEPVAGLHLAIVSNTTPWTFFGTRPVTLSRTAAFDRGLDVVAMRRLRTLSTLWAVSGMFGATGIRGRAARVWEDLAEFTVTAERATHVQVDGDYLGERERVRFAAVPHALRVLV